MKPGPNYKWSVVWMIWCISLFNYADRQAIFSVFPLLEKEMGLSNCNWDFSVRPSRGSTVSVRRWPG